MCHLCVRSAIRQIFEQRQNVSISFVFTSRDCLFTSDRGAKSAFRTMEGIINTRRTEMYHGQIVAKEVPSAQQKDLIHIELSHVSREVKFSDI
jgi:hypothetical protein